VVDEEEARGEEGSCAGVGFGEDTRACFLRLHQGLSSGPESLRHRFVRGRAWSGGAETDVDVKAEAKADGASRSDSVRGVAVRNFAPGAGEVVLFVGASPRERARRVMS
jgi:hypothetical protein